MTLDLAESDNRQVADVVDCLRAVVGEALVGAYLHGSAVLGGLRPHSDLDVLAVTARPATDAEKSDLVDRSLVISGWGPALAQPRPVEVTVVVGSEVRPWRHPPRRDFQYGEWWRDRFERRDPELWRPKEDPDLADPRVDDVARRHRGERTFPLERVGPRSAGGLHGCGPRRVT